MDAYSLEILKKTYEIHKDYVTKLINIKEEYKIPIRYPGIPEHISENIVKFIIRKVEHSNKCSWECKGDLVNDDKIVECKSITSDAPISFGPTEKWDQLYILDARKWISNSLTLYRINLSNDDNKWRNIKFSSTETYKDKCVVKTRPRICWSKLKTQVTPELVFEGTFEDIFIIKRKRDESHEYSIIPRKIQKFI